MKQLINLLLLKIFFLSTFSFGASSEEVLTKTHQELRAKYDHDLSQKLRDIEEKFEKFTKNQTKDPYLLAVASDERRKAIQRKNQEYQKKLAHLLTALPAVNSILFFAKEAGIQTILEIKTNSDLNASSALSIDPRISWIYRRSINNNSETTLLVIFHPERSLEETETSKAVKKFLELGGKYVAIIAREKGDFRDPLVKTLWLKFDNFYEEDVAKDTLFLYKAKK